ncbi:MAG: hypothetical protein AAFZ15_32720 [Bacteroidota bacterium]
MNKKTALSIRLELIWWVVTLLVLAGVLFPIYRSEANYPFWLSNTIFVVVAITISRYVFLLKYTFLANQQWLKVAVAILSIPLFIYLLDDFSFFRAIADEIGLEEIFEHLSLNGQISMANYVKSEMLFFGAASLICSVLLPIRMVVSFWRTHNNRGI